MSKEILDENWDLEIPFKKKRTLQSQISICLLWLGIFLCFMLGAFFSVKIVIAFILLTITTYLHFSSRENESKLTLVILLLYLFGLIHFYPIQYSIGIIIWGITLSIDLIALIILIFHIIFNRDILSPFFKKVIYRKISKEESESIERTKINGFKNRFGRKTNSELQTIVHNRLLVPEAIKAAVELIQEREEKP